MDMAGYEEAIKKHKTVSGKGRRSSSSPPSRANCRRPTIRPSTARSTATGKVVGWVKDNAVSRRRPAGGGRRSRPAARPHQLLRRARRPGRRHRHHPTPTRRPSRWRTRRSSAMRCCTSAASARATSRRASQRRWRSAAIGRTPCATTPPRTCSTGRCARCWATTSSRRARWSMRTRRASTSPTTSRCRTSEIAEVERLVNEKIYADLPVTAVTMPLAEAKKIAGVRAVFGEKYPDPVRVLLIGAEAPEEATAGALRRVLRRHASAPHRPGGLLQDRQPGSGGQGRAPRHRRHRPGSGGRRCRSCRRRWTTLTSALNCKPEEVPAPRRGAAGRDQEAADSS